MSSKVEENLKNQFKRLLNEVKNYSKLNNEPGRMEDIAAMLGYNRTYLSDLVGSKGVVTEDHIRHLKLNFPFLNRLEPGYVEKKIAAPTDQEVPLYSLIESNKALAFANKEMAETNKELAVMLKVQMSSGSHPSVLEQRENDRILEHLAEQGVKDGLWPSQADGLVKLGKLLFSYNQKSVAVHKSNV